MKRGNLVLIGEMEAGPGEHVQCDLARRLHPMEDTILREPIKFQGQRVLPSERPGLGVEIDRNRLAKLTVAEETLGKGVSR